MLLVPKGRPLEEGRIVVGTQALPAGTWVVQRVVIELEGWSLWASGKGRELELKPGGTARLEFGKSVEVATKGFRQKDKVVGNGCLTFHGMGATLLKSGERIEISWLLRSGDQKIVEVECDYG